MTQRMPDPLDVVADALGCKRGDLCSDSAMYRDHDWDSFGQVKVVLAIEETLEIDIDDETAMTLTSVAAIRDFFRRQSGSSRG